jgi:hypothetical protein
MATRFAQAGVEAAIQSIASLRVAQVGVEVAYLPVGNIPAKATSLAAYYQTGWFGNDSPDLMKMFRFGHIVTSNSGIKLTAQVVDDENYTFNNPLIVPLKIVAGNRFSVNRKGRRMNILIEFPPNDVDITVLELSVSYIPSSQR